MDFRTLHQLLDPYDFPLFTLGKTEISTFSLLKLLIFGTLLYFLAGRFSRWTLARLLGHTRMDTGQRAAVIGLVHYTVLVIGAVLILENAGINLTAFAVVGSALGVGVGFGLQNIISNFISGIILLLERPIEVGHRIELAGVEGVVREIRARFTTVVTPDNVAILVPNQRFITDNVTNYVFLGRTVRLRVPVSVAPGSDVRAVQRLLMDAAKGVDVEAEPEPEVALTGMSSTAIGFELWVWYDGQRYARQEVLSRLYYSVSDALGVHGIKPG